MNVLPQGLAEAAAADYGPEYYATHCGPIPYHRSHEHWGRFFGSIADELIRIFRPARIFDAGCAHGFLVEAFWDRGIEAWGRDISEFAISQVRADVQPFCTVGSLAEKIDGHYDLVTCIEVLEHMTEPGAIKAVANMAAVTDRIIFSSSPTDLTEPTHINVKPPIYWLRLFASQGFAPVATVTLPFITPYALAFERSEVGRDERDLLVCAELVWRRLQLFQIGQRAGELGAQVGQQTLQIADLNRHIAERDGVVARLNCEINQRAEERDRTVAELHQQIQERDRTTADLQQQI